MLWELGLAKSLYQLLITAEKRDERLYAKTAICPLGEVLMQFFNLVGGTLKISNAETRIAHFLTPDSLGKLYRACFSTTTDKGFSNILAPEKLKRKDLRKSIGNLSQALAGCAVVGTFNPVNLCPSLIMAFFWAKYIQPCSQAEAGRNLAVFNEAANIEITTSCRHDDLRALEEYAIQSMQIYHRANLPAPIPMGSANVGAQNFSDCVESCLRAFFYALIKNKPLDEGQAGFFDSAVEEYFRKNNGLEKLYTQAARDEWATILANHPNIAYNNTAEGNYCEVASQGNNVMCLLAQLVPGAYKQLVASCLDFGSGCTCPGLSRDLLESVDMNAHTAEIKRHFLASSSCYEKFINKIANAQNLQIKEFSSSGNKISWHLYNDDSCYLGCTIDAGHSYAEFFFGKAEQGAAFNDPILTSINALHEQPKHPAKIAPLLLLAAGIVQRREFAEGYIGLMPTVIMPDAVLPKDRFTEIVKFLMPLKNNLFSWDIFTSNEKDFLERDIATKESLFCKAIMSRLLDCVKFLHGLGVDLGILDRWHTPAYALAAGTGDLRMLQYFDASSDWYAAPVVIIDALTAAAAHNCEMEIFEYLCQHKYFNRSVHSPEKLYLLMRAAFLCLHNESVLDYLSKTMHFDFNMCGGTNPLLISAILSNAPFQNIQYMCAHGANIEASGSTLLMGAGVTPLMAAALKGLMPVVEYLCSRGADISKKNIAGTTALDIARDKGFLAIVKYLEDETARRTGDTGAASGGGPVPR
jgi:hypothetical protein